MKIKTGTVFLIAALFFFSIAAISAVIYFDQRSKNKPPQLSKAELSNVIKSKHKELFQNQNDPILGNPNGDVTLVEFFDYRCVYCKLVHPVVTDVLKEDGNIRYVAKEYPILGPVSMVASRAALASRSQGKYAVYSQALMAAKRLKEDMVFDIARKVGIDLVQLRDDMATQDGKISAQISANIALGKDLALQGTPIFIIANKLVAGAMNKAQLTKLIAWARHNKGAF